MKYLKRVWAWIKAEAVGVKTFAVDTYNTFTHDDNTRLRVGLAVVGGAGLFALGVAHAPGLMVVGISALISQLIWPGSVSRGVRSLAKLLYVVSVAALLVYHPMWALVACTVLVVTTSNLEEEDGLEWTFRSFASRMDSALEQRPYLMIVGFLFSPIAFVCGTIGGHIIAENMAALPAGPTSPELVSI